MSTPANTSTSQRGAACRTIVSLTPIHAPTTHWVASRTAGNVTLVLVVTHGPSPH